MNDRGNDLNRAMEKRASLFIAAPAVAFQQDLFLF